MGGNRVHEFRAPVAGCRGNVEHGTRPIGCGAKCVGLIDIRIAEHIDFIEHHPALALEQLYSYVSYALESEPASARPM